MILDESLFESIRTRRGVDRLRRFRRDMTESEEGDRIAQANIDSKNINFEKDKENERQVKLQLAKQGIVKEDTNEDLQARNIVGEDLTFKFKNDKCVITINGKDRVVDLEPGQEQEDLKKNLIKMGFKEIKSKGMKESYYPEIVLSRHDALDIFEDIEEDTYWYNGRYDANFKLNDYELVISGSADALNQIIDDYHLEDYGIDKFLVTYEDLEEDLLEDNKYAPLSDRKPYKVFVPGDHVRYINNDGWTDGGKANIGRTGVILDSNYIGKTEVFHIKADDHRETHGYADDSFLANSNNLEFVESLKEDLSIEEQQNIGLVTLVNNLITSENDAINDYESAIATFAAEGRDEFMDVFDDIIKEEQTHIGQLQSILEQLKPGTITDLEKGQAEADGQIAEIEGDDMEAIMDIEDADIDITGDALADLENERKAVMSAYIGENVNTNSNVAINENIKDNIPVNTNDVLADLENERASAMKEVLGE